jgi:hypothetical protein
MVGANGCIVVVIWVIEILFVGGNVRVWFNGVISVEWEE